MSVVSIDSILSEFVKLLTTDCDYCGTWQRICRICLMQLLLSLRCDLWWPMHTSLFLRVAGLQLHDIVFFRFRIQALKVASIHPNLPGSWTCLQNYRCVRICELSKPFASTLKMPFAAALHSNLRRQIAQAPEEPNPSTPSGNNEQQFHYRRVQRPFVHSVDKAKRGEYGLDIFSASGQRSSPFLIKLLDFAHVVVHLPALLVVDLLLSVYICKMPIPDPTWATFSIFCSLYELNLAFLSSLTLRSQRYWSSWKFPAFWSSILNLPGLSISARCLCLHT